MAKREEKEHLYHYYYSYLMYWDVNNLSGLEMSQQLPVNNAELPKNILKEDSIRNLQ